MQKDGEKIEEEIVSPWQVHSYQVPVPLGDCSFHFLVDTSNSKRDINTAILVDGGRDHDAAAKVIRDTVVTLTPNYTWHGMEGFLGFDWWLVTHWDNDHYAGALKYFENLLGTKDNKIDYAFPRPRVFGPVGALNDLYGISISDDRDTIGKVFHEENELEKVYKIGCDFFNVKEDGDMEVYDILEVWSQSQSINPGMPCFLCIGSMGKYLTSQNSDEVTVTGKNETSAFFAIVWPETKTFSYYAAGDGNIKVEEKFQEQSLLGGEPFKGALVAKATHHGALKAFHEGFFKHLSPAYYVVSAGKEYGHPTAALLLKLAILTAYKEPPMKLYTSRFPYYLYDEADNSKTDLNFDSLRAVLAEMAEKNLLPPDEETLWERSEELNQVSKGHEDEKKVQEWVKDMQNHLLKIWEILSRYEPPQGSKEEASYLIQMVFSLSGHEAMVEEPHAILL